MGGARWWSRCSSSAAVAALAALLGTKVLIGWLGRRAVYQPILSTSEGGPGHESKAGTPTMGGLAIVGAACVGYAVAHLRSGVIFTRSGLFVMLAMIGAGFVGFLDDWIKVRNARNLGLNKRTKMIGLLVVSIGFAVLYLRLHQRVDEPRLHPLRSARPRARQHRVDNPRDLPDPRHDERGEPHRRARRPLLGLVDPVVRSVRGDRLLGLPPSGRVPAPARARPLRGGRRDARRLRGVPLVERRAGQIIMGDTGSLAIGGARSRASRSPRTPSCCSRSSAGCSSPRRCR